MEQSTDNSNKSNRLLTFKDMMAVDYTWGSWDDEEGLIAKQFAKRHSEDFGESVSPDQEAASEAAAMTKAAKLATKLREIKRWKKSKGK
jgi:hypothetical protein